MYKAILFDLDGTLTDSGEGITKSVQYALEKVGKPEPDLQKLRVFVGPPLLEQFQEYAELTKKRQERQLRFTENDMRRWEFMRMNCIPAFRKCYPD